MSKKRQGRTHFSDCAGAFRGCLQIFVLWASATFCVQDAAAHASGENYVFVSFNADSISGHFEIHEDDLEGKLGIDMPPGEAEAVAAELAKSAHQVHAYINEHFKMSPVGGDAYALTFGETKVFDLEVKRFGQYHFSVPVKTLPDVVEFDHQMLYENDPLHRAVLAVLYNDKTEQTDGADFGALIFSSNTPVQQLDLTKTIEGLLRPMDFLRQSLRHIWIGIDHILFLIVVLLPVVLKREDGNWLPIPTYSKAGWNTLMIVTIFTIAYSITLSVAVL
jgi:hypothetical protein